MAAGENGEEIYGFKEILLVGRSYSGKIDLDSWLHFLSRNNKYYSQENRPALNHTKSKGYLYLFI